MLERFFGNLVAAAQAREARPVLMVGELAGV